MNTSRVVRLIGVVLCLVSCEGPQPTPSSISDPPAVVRLYKPFDDHTGPSEFSWAPDGQHLLATTLWGVQANKGNALLDIVTSSGVVTTLIPETQMMFVDAPVFYPDGSQVLIRRRDGGHHPPGIWRMSLTDSSFAFVRPGYQATLSNDGKWLAIFVGPSTEMHVDQWAIQVWPTSSDQPGQDIALGSSGRIDLFGMSLSPDGTVLAYSSSPDATSPPFPPATLRVLAWRSGAALHPIDGATNYIFPAWSPDGKRLAAIQQTSSVSIGKLVIWDLASGCRNELIGVDDIGFVAWSPDGEEIAFSHFAEIYILDIQQARKSGKLDQICP